MKNQPQVDFYNENEKKVGPRIIKALYLCLEEEYLQGEVMSIIFRTFSQSTPWRNCQMIFQDSLSQSPKALVVATALAA